MAGSARHGHAKPRLIQLLDFDRREGGSFISMIRAALVESRSRGWETGVITFAGAHSSPWIETLIQEGVDVRLAPVALRGYRRGLGRWLRTQLPAEGPLVLHSHFHGFDIAAGFAVVGRPRTTMVWHVHSAYAHDAIQITLAVAKFGLFGRRVDAFLCPAQNIVDATVRRGVPRSRVHLLPSAIEPEDLSLTSAEAKLEAKRSLGLDESRTVLLHFGWHWHLKGGDVFLEVIRELVDRGYSNVLALERGGAERYQRYASELGISEHLHIQGSVDHIRSLHQAADVLVCSSREEGMAYATLEALCSGTPVVATAIPGHVYVGRHVDACRLTGHSPMEIADGIVETLDRPSTTVVAETQEGRDWVVRNLSTQVVARDLVDRYAALAEARP